MSLNDYLKRGIQKLNSKASADRQPPEHLPDQRTLIHRAFDTDKTVWLFFFDAGRYDIFDQLVWDYFHGELKRCYNGGVGYTGDWADRNLRYDFGNRGVFSWLPLREHQGGNYDGRDYFEVAPDLIEQESRHEQLAALGYAESHTEQTYEISPQFVNKAVRNNADSLDGGVVRYLKPHPPFDGLEEMTSESTKTANTQAALDNGQLTYQELTDAYIETYHTAFEFASRLIPKLDGRVIITSDHGTCLTCGQLFHGRNLEKHDHLTVMPWFEVDTTL